MMRSLKEINADIESAEDRLTALMDEREQFQLAQSKFNIGEVITFGRKREEGKIVALDVRYGMEATPIVVMKKKNGEWGDRQKRLYSWDLEQ